MRLRRQRQRSRERSFVDPWPARAALLATGLAALSALGCATTQGATPPVAVELEVTDLREEEADVLRQEVEKIPGVSAMNVERKRTVSTFRFQYQGQLHELNRRIQAVPHPGLKPGEMSALLRYEGFDNLPPTVDLLSPDITRAFAETKASLVLEVPDTDLKSLTAAGKRATKRPGSTIYDVEVPLTEGQNVIDVLAIDDAGNETALPLKIYVDTTPPDVQAEVKMLVTGKVEPGSSVFVEGRQVETDRSGAWETQISIRQGQTTIEIVAIDRNGNKKVEKRSIFGGKGGS